jgi:hypothetical protein
MKASTQPPVYLEHARLRALAKRLGELHADDAEILNLATELMQIGYGVDANEALGVKRGKGHDDKKAQAHMKTQMAIRWIACRLNSVGPVDSEGRMTPDPEEPPTKAAAIKEASRLYGLNPENLHRACPTKAELTRLADFGWDDQRPVINKTRD